MNRIKRIWIDMRRKRVEILAWRQAEAERLIREGIPACANCKYVPVARKGLYCATCADGLH